jgi:D-glycero-alpha-D-manno-heptose-7-phosphate kinase
MFITKTPFRISFFGGGTDLPSWSRENGGKVLSTTFDKYCYISVRSLPEFFDHKYRIVYSKIENTKEINQIQHPAVREILRYFDIRKGLEVHHDSDLPARSGLGSSSSFSVGLINALNSYKNKSFLKYDLASLAIHIEQDLIRECVGSQDQVAAAYGGFNEIDFYQDNTFLVKPLAAKKSRLDELNDNLMLFFTGIQRFASEVSASQIANIRNCTSQMNTLSDMVDQGVSILKNTNTSIDEFGLLLNESWNIKKTLSPDVSSLKIDELYTSGLSCGALGGKVLGAGGGGFMLFFVRPEDQHKVKEKLKNLVHVPFKFENSGSSFILKGD